jgi:hypothetical protein
MDDPTTGAATIAVGLAVGCLIFWFFSDWHLERHGHEKNRRD